MQEVGMTLELKAMWCAFTYGHDDKNHLEQVSNLICCHHNCQYLTFVIERSLVRRVPSHYRNLTLELGAFKWFLKFCLFEKR